MEQGEENAENKDGNARNEMEMQGISLGMRNWVKPGWKCEKCKELGWRCRESK